MGKCPDGVRGGERDSLQNAASILGIERLSVVPPPPCRPSLPPLISMVIPPTPIFCVKSISDGYTEVRLHTRRSNRPVDLVALANRAVTSPDLPVL